MMPKLLCIEIGTSMVRLAEVVKTGKSIEIKKTFAFNTPDDAIKDGKVRISDELVTSIRDGLDASGIKTKDVYFVVDSTRILFKHVNNLPFVQKNMIQKMLENAFSDMFPVDETAYHISYVYNNSYEKNGQKLMDLDVYAIPNDISENYYNLSVDLGLNAKGLSGSNDSMLSLFPSSFKNGNVAMVNINENISTIAVAVDGHMIFNKTIPYGVYDTIRQVINSKLTMDGISVTDAIEYLYSANILLKQTPDSITDDTNEEDKLHYSATMSLIPLIRVIESTLSAFLKNENIQIKEFQISGLGAGFSGISQLLAYEFGGPVKVVQQGDNLRMSATAASDTLIVSYYPCVGAAINAVNFFTKEEQAGGEIANKKRIDRMFVFAGTLACIASLGYGAYSWLQAGLAHQDVYDENIRLSKRVQELRDIGVETAYNNYTTALSYNTEVNVLYNRTRSGNEDMTTFLAELESILPTTARVSGMTLTPISASVSFRCDDKFIAAGVLHLLRNMYTIDNMECSGVAEIEKTGEIAFTCTFKLKATADRPNNEDVEEPEVDTNDENPNNDKQDVEINSVELSNNEQESDASKNDSNEREIGGEQS